MSISARVSAYLDAQRIGYDTVRHSHSNSSLGAAIAAKIPAKSIAKAVVLQDHESRHLMAVVPANHKVKLHDLARQLNLDLHFVEEEEVYRLFNDCDPGAVPAVGQAYHMNTVCDEALDQLGDVYLEAGDHETLIHLTADQYGQLMKDSKHGSFSAATFY